MSEAQSSFLNTPPRSEEEVRRLIGERRTALILAISDNLSEALNDTILRAILPLEDDLAASAQVIEENVLALLGTLVAVRMARTGEGAPRTALRVALDVVAALRHADWPPIERAYPWPNPLRVRRG